MKPTKFYGRSKLRAKLTFDDGYAERPIYSIKAMTSEIQKGFDMIELIKNNFNIDNKNIEEATLKNKDEILADIEDMKDMKDQMMNDPFTRDEKGNIVSPFRSKRKLI